MKESNFYSDEFEQLLREKTEQYKMYPSEKVWKGIHSSLHTKRRWFISGMSLLITGILFFAGRELLSPSKAALAKHTAAATHGTLDAASVNDDADNSSPLIASSGRRNSSSSIAGRHAGQSSDDQSYKEVNVRISDTAPSSQDISEMLSQVVSLPSEPPSIPIVAVLRTPSPATVANNSTTNTDDAAIAQTSKPGMASGNVPAGAAPTDRPVALVSNAPGTAGALTDASKDIDAPARALRNSMPPRNTLAVTRSSSGSVAGSESLVDSSRKSAGSSVVFTDAIADQQRINWLYDYAVYNLPAAAKRGRKYLQMYISPTINYRSLSGGDFGPKNYVSDPLHRNIKDFFGHNPVFGFEVGSSIMYRLTRNLTVKAGLQFNFSRYGVKAYTNTQQSTADINTPYGYYLDSMTAARNNSSFAPKSQIGLTNDAYQLSAPIGFELRVMGNERLQLNVGATIQPSYLLNANSYYLTSDYTNYIKSPSQYRKWNLIGGVEAFLSYKLHNGLRLQAGPEFRYQLMSSFNNSYPIQENMKGYGLKIGIVKAIP